MIGFDENGHIYKDLITGQECLSVTSFISMFKQKKDWDKIATAYAKKHKKSVEEVKAAWKFENDISVERGNKFHKAREQEITSHKTINDLPIFKPEFKDNTKISKTQKLEPGLYPELIVYLKSAGICGQVDYPEITKDYVLNIDDYKTNKEIKTEGYKNWDGTYDMMTGPFGNFHDCNFSHYSLQLNIYAYIIKKNNPKIKIGKLRILHIKFDSNGEVESIIPMEVPNLQADVKRAIDWYIKNKK